MGVIVNNEDQVEATNGGLVQLPDESDEQLMRDAENVFTEMYECMESGDLVDWAHRHLSDRVQWVISGKIGDPSEDGASVGIEAFLRWYNTMLEVFNPGSQSPSWDIRQEVHMLSRETFQILWDQTLSCPPAIRTRYRQFFMSLRNGKVHYLNMAPQYPELDMEESIIRLRSCLPASDVDVPQPPCGHNSWDSMRAKHTFTVLKCRVCGETWRLHASASHAFRCTDFLAGHCPVQELGFCRRIHIHPRKRRAHEYNQKPDCKGAAPELTLLGEIVAAEWLPPAAV
ncbi:hypothetical protein DIPPA_22530 [Diplonema papillatum]|nr:hypothetical protein DIPPA_22530 [Diplonema papillatum]